MPVRGLRLHVRQWEEGRGTPFVLLHGLASNCRTWEAVARGLNAAGHPVVAVDQRGHGLSDKPEDGYGFDEVTADLLALLDALALAEPPIVAGQSWGGNVALDFAARYPRAARGVVLVDGGLIELSAWPGASWERVERDLAPPDLTGTPREELRDRLRRAHPGWSEEGIEHTLANFETLPDGTVRPWLARERHMAILRALWEHRPSSLFGRVTAPTLVVLAENRDLLWNRQKRREAARAQAALARCRVHWFPDTDHDVHVHRPADLTAVIFDALRDGFFAGREPSANHRSQEEQPWTPS